MEAAVLNASLLASEALAVCDTDMDWREVAARGAAR